MKISELKAGQGKVDIELKIRSKTEPRTINKYGKVLIVANAVGEDDSGDIKITLWNDDVTKVNAGDKIKISNGYVSEFNGERQLTSGKFGKIEVVSGSENPEKVVDENKKDKVKKAKKEKIETKKDTTSEENFDNDAF
jgi:replication factor A1